MCVCVNFHVHVVRDLPLERPSIDCCGQQRSEADRAPFDDNP